MTSTENPPSDVPSAAFLVWEKSAVATFTLMFNFMTGWIIYPIFSRRTWSHIVAFWLGYFTFDVVLFDLVLGVPTFMDFLALPTYFALYCLYFLSQEGAKWDWIQMDGKDDAGADDDDDDDDDDYQPTDDEEDEGEEGDGDDGTGDTSEPLVD